MSAVGTTHTWKVSFRCAGDASGAVTTRIRITGTRVIDAEWFAWISACTILRLGGLSFSQTGLCIHIYVKPYMFQSLAAEIFLPKALHSLRTLVRMILNTMQMLSLIPFRKMVGSMYRVYHQNHLDHNFQKPPVNVLLLLLWFIVFYNRKQSYQKNSNQRNRPTTIRFENHFENATERFCSFFDLYTEALKQHIKLISDAVLLHDTYK